MPLAMTPDEKKDLESLFSTLSTNKQRFLEARLYCKTDKEAAEVVRFTDKAITKWKANDPAFKRCHELITTKMFDLEKNIVMAVEKSNAVTAVREKQKILNKPWGECTAREAAAKATMIQDTLERVAPKKGGTEQSVSVSIMEILAMEEEEPDAVQDKKVKKREIQSDQPPRSKVEINDKEEGTSSSEDNEE